MFNTFEMFCTVLDQTTADYECMVIKNNTNSNNLKDQVFWYRAGKPRSFKIGHRQFWEMSESLGGDDDDDDVIPLPGANKKGTQIHVRKTG
jgi:hypothetical protein